MIVFIIVFSFLMDSIVSNLFSINSLFLPLFSLISLILIYPFLNKQNDKFYMISFVMGIFYDLIYTDTVIVHAILFLFIAFIITKLNIIFSNNFVNNSIMSIIIIIVYETILFVFLLLTANINFDLFYLLKAIYSSIIINIIYIVFMSIFTDYLSNKFKIKKRR